MKCFGTLSFWEKPFVWGSLFLVGMLLLQITRLFPNDFLTVLAFLIMGFAPLAACAGWLLRAGVDRFALMFFILSAIVSFHYLHISHDNAYTNDWHGHFDHITFIANHWFDPYGYGGDQLHHPPLYYYLAGIVIRLADLLGVSQLTGLRFFSWVAFLWFNAFSLLTLRRGGLSGMTYRSCAALLLLWPAGLHMASKISNEPLYYACYAATFYYTVLWYQEGKERSLMMAVVLAGLTFTVRTSALILFGLIGIGLLVAWWRGRLQERFFFTRRWLYIGVGIGMCALANLGRLIGQPFLKGLDSHFGSYNGSPFPVSNFLTFSFTNMVEKPFNDWSLGQSFWNVLFKTSVFGEYRWPWPEYAAVLNLSCFCIILYAMLPWLWATRVQWRGMAPFISGLMLPVIALLLFAYVRHTLSHEDARFLYPSLVCFVICFGRSQQRFARQDNMVLMAAGYGLPWLFAGLSVIYFWVNFR